MELARNNAKRRRQQAALDEAARIDEELQHQIAVVEKAIEHSTGAQREHYRALLRALQHALEKQPDL